MKDIFLIMWIASYDDNNKNIFKYIIIFVERDLKSK